MKYIFVLLMTAGLCFGCSKQEKKSEQMGSDIADRMQGQLDKARTVSEKARESRDVELPK